jgi:hypothetical protein
MDWLGKDHVLLLTGIPKCEPGDLARLVEPLGLKGSITTRYDLAEREIKRLLIEEGVSYLWQLVKLQEDILPRTPDLPALLAVLRNMLHRIRPTEELIIVDRFLLPRACPDCLDTLTYLISPIPDSVSRIVLVTRKEYDEQLLNDLRTALKDRKCEVVHAVSETSMTGFGSPIAPEVSLLELHQTGLVSGTH